MEIIQLSAHMVQLAVGVCALTAILCVLGLALKDFRFVTAARRSLYCIFGLTFLSSAGLVYGFVEGVYTVKYINHYSEASLPLPYKIAGLWAGLDGSILFWCLLLAFFGAIVAFIHRREGLAEPERRKLEPYLYIILALNTGFFLYAAVFVTNPFQPFPPEVLAQGRYDPTGTGLNPLLVTYWMLVHPPSLYLGFTCFTVPFAYAMASLLSGQQGIWWIRFTRRWTMVAWLILTNGVILGGMWAYEVLGWGGYWAWDPVENASLLPWLVATAYLHSVMVQERRAMLKRWNLLLIIITFFLCNFGTYLTRSGVVASVHAFASGEIGTYLEGYLIFVLVFSLTLLLARMDTLKGEHEMKSFLSREAMFFFNNLALVLIAAAVTLLTLWPTISEALFDQQVSVMAPTYNRVTLPLFLFLIFLTAVGPQIGWVKSTFRNVARTFAYPFAAAMGLGAVIIYYWVRQGWDPGWKPIALALGATFVITTVFLEFYRGTRARMAFKKEGAGDALMSLVVTNNRRYGGYIVHFGFAICVIGIVTSAFFQTKLEAKDLEPGGTAKVGNRWEVTFKGTSREETGPYSVTYLDMGISKGGEEVAVIRPEVRHYHKKDARGEKPTVREVAIHRTFWEDLYIFPARDEIGSGGGVVTFTFFINPLINWIWAGWIIILAGGLLAILPMGRRRVGLSD